MGTFILRSDGDMEDYETGIEYFVIELTRRRAAKLIQKIQNFRAFSRSNSGLQYMCYRDPSGVYCGKADLPIDVANAVKDMEWGEWVAADVDITAIKQPCKDYGRNLFVSYHHVGWSAKMNDFEAYTAFFSLKELTAIASSDS